MKHCPACNFSFPDFHIVCDFDGTELVPDPERPSLVKSPPLSRFQSALQSPRFWGGLLAVAVVSYTFLFALYDARRRNTPAVDAQPSPAAPAAIGNVIPSAQNAELWPGLNRTPAPATRAGSRDVSGLASQRRQAQSARTRVRQQNTSAANRPKRDYSPARTLPSANPAPSLATESANKQQQSGSPRQRNLSTEARPSEIARRTDSQRTSPEKERKLTAMLKATWHVLKKPFKF
jgi:type IV secretory pathway VirB10-like protein